MDKIPAYIALGATFAVLVMTLYSMLKPRGESLLDKMERQSMVRAELKAVRDDLSAQLDRARDSLSQQLSAQQGAQTEQFENFRTTLTNLFNSYAKVSTDSAERQRTNVETKLSEAAESQRRQLSEISAASVQSMEAVRNKLDERLDKIGLQLDKSLVELRESNEKKLDQMRQTVDEKLEKTLETRLQKSFETVSTQLESVNRGLGEMKSVAESVGSLNKVLSGSKTRGILGELQLGQIIEDILPSNLYGREVATKSGSRDHVEYAVKLPGAADGETVWLPIDSKFPLEDYYRLLDGYEAGDAAVIDVSRKALLARVKQFAKDVKAKYVSPPETTPFAVIFLPTEGLYSEIARDAAFFEELRREDIMVTGPTTLSAMLQSLQIGFKTLQIQKGAAEIEKTLGAVKKEFESFEGVLSKAQERITQAGSELDKLVGTRTRAINRTLRDVQTYSETLLGDGEESAEEKSLAE
ncbi:MAG: DNA recombination protein RmuC [Oscillospiraceae bacterium]|nr:DNA recombination protein RmuC [Oscillospiraceae bacterium]